MIASLALRMLHPALPAAARQQRFVANKPDTGQTRSNQAIQRELANQAWQPKLAINQPGDVYEQEAGRVAGSVMRMPDAVETQRTEKVLQRQSAGPSAEQIEKTGNIETLIRNNWKKYIDQAKFKSPLKDRITWYATNGELLLAKWNVCERLAEDHLRKSGAGERKGLFERNKSMVVSEQPTFEQVKPYIVAALKTSFFSDLGDKDVPAFYDPTTGKIHILGDKVGLIAHEALHSYSSPEFKEVLGADMDEGMSEYLSEEIEHDYMIAFAKDQGIPVVISAYGKQVGTIEELVKSGAVKRDDLLNAYFHGGKALLSQIKKARDRASQAKAAKETSESVPQQPEKPQPAPQTPREEKQLQRAVAPNASGSDTAPPIVHDVLRSPGHPLDAATRRFMEPRFGRDFSGVRVHTDRQAAESARAVNALAYTVGRNIVFAAGQYAPETQSSQRLIAHELSHVSQQTGGSSSVGGQAGAGTMMPETMIQRTPAIGFAVTKLQPDAGKLDDPMDNGRGQVTWPLSFAVTSPLEAEADVEVTGGPGVSCADVEVGWVQAVHINWLRLYYDGRKADDGSSMIDITAPVPIRDGDPDTSWYSETAHESPANCGDTISVGINDYPTVFDVEKVIDNAKTGAKNFLTGISRGIHFVTTLVGQGPSGITPLKFFYWNYLMDIHFQPNFASPTSEWPFHWKKNVANIGHVHSGKDGSVPLFTSVTPVYNKSLTPHLTQRTQHK